MLYKLVKKVWAEFLLVEFGAFLLLPQEVQELWTHECHGWIQGIRKVQKSLGRSSNCSFTTVGNESVAMCSGLRMLLPVDPIVC